MRNRLRLGSWMGLGFAVAAAPLPAQVSDTNPPLKWTAREWLYSHANANDEGSDIVYWFEDANPDKHWVYSTGWVSDLNGNNSLRGTRFATYQYDGGSDGSGGDLNPTNSAFFPVLAAGISQGDTYKAYAMTVDPTSGDIFITGEGPHTPGTANNQDYFVVKYDSDLGFEWYATYEGGYGNDIPVDIALSNDGDVVVVTGTSPGNGTQDDIATVAWFTSNGARAASGENYWPDIGWGAGVRRYNNDAEDGDDTATELGPVTVAVTEEDTPTTYLVAVVLGTSWGGSTYNDFILHRWSTDDAAYTEIRYDNGLNDVATGLANDGSAYHWCIGHSEFPYEGDTPDYNINYAIQSVGDDAYGDFQQRWSRTWDYAAYDDFPADIVVKNLGNGNFDVWGTGKAYNGSKYVAATVYYFDDGTPPSSPDFSAVNGAGSSFNYGKSITLGTVTPFQPYITGQVGSGGTDYMLALKYRNNSGWAQHWQKFYENGGFDEGKVVIAKPVGTTGTNMSVYIVGTSASTSNGRDFCTWKYKE